LFCHSNRIEGLDDTKLFTFEPDQADFWDANFSVNTVGLIGGDVDNSLKN
jgi:hypothetical protein